MIKNQMESILKEYVKIKEKQSTLSRMERDRIVTFVHLMIMKGELKIEPITDADSTNSNDIQPTTVPT